MSNLRSLATAAECIRVGSKVGCHVGGLVDKRNSTRAPRLLEPHDCARILHGCASIVRLTLLKGLPNTIAAVQVLLKTNDIAQGHHLLVTAFEPFGEIVDASIAPKNRGF